jgi:tRNA dimethylallyltransferase
VYRGLDIGTDKVPLVDRRGIPHHLIVVVDPREVYSAARFAQEAAHVIREVLKRGRTPVIVGGTGLYYRALTRGLFPGPGADDRLRARLDRIADRRGVEHLHAMVRCVDPASADRIMPRDRKRLIRALEVFRTTGTTLTAHFGATVSPLADCDVVTVALEIPTGLTTERVTRRVDQQFARGITREVEGLLAGGVPPRARSLGGLVYRQVMELLQGVRDEVSTRALIVQENRRYARRQLAWFRKESSLQWLEGPGEQPGVQERAYVLMR